MSISVASIFSPSLKTHITKVLRSSPFSLSARIDPYLSGLMHGVDSAHNLTVTMIFGLLVAVRGYMGEEDQLLRLDESYIFVLVWELDGYGSVLK